tara:strand:- start:11 stop:295 length:285 start_codon:yes stop_codon:yes gene_type:complete
MQQFQGDVLVDFVVTIRCFVIPYLDDSEEVVFFCRFCITFFPSWLTSSQWAGFALFMVKTMTGVDVQVLPEPHDITFFEAVNHCIFLSTARGLS